MYQYKDHLGNIRLSYKDVNDDNEVTGASTQVFYDDFESASGWGHSISGFDINFKYDGQYSGKIDRLTSEEQSVHSLEWVPINNTTDTEYIYSGWAYSNGPLIRMELAMRKENETGVVTLLDDVYNGYRGRWNYLEKKVRVPSHIKAINIRISAGSGGANGTVWWDNVSIRRVNSSNIIEIVEENAYYAFGLEHKGYNNNVSAFANSAARKFGFGGKEHQDELGLGWIDVTARNYDASLGRWFVIDPLAEVTYSQSTYHYAYNNPIYFIDPDGLTGQAHEGYYDDGAGNVVFDPNVNSKADVDALGLDGASYIGDVYYDNSSGTYYDENGVAHENMKLDWGNMKYEWSFSLWLKSLDGATQGNATYTVGSGFVLIGKGGSGLDTNTTSENPEDDIYIPEEVINALTGMAGVGSKRVWTDGRTRSVLIRKSKSVVTKTKEALKKFKKGMSHAKKVKKYATNAGSISVTNSDTLTYVVEGFSTTNPEMRGFINQDPVGLKNAKQAARELKATPEIDSVTVKKKY